MATDVIASFQDCVCGLLDEDGVYPHVMVFERDEDAIVEFVDLREPISVLCHCLKRLLEDKPRSLVFGMDRFALPEHGVNTTDFVSVYYWHDGAWEFGVCEYEKDKVVALRWDCEFWRERMSGEIKMAMSRLLKIDGLRPF